MQISILKHKLPLTTNQDKLVCGHDIMCVESTINHTCLRGRVVNALGRNVQ